MQQWQRLKVHARDAICATHCFCGGEAQATDVPSNKEIITINCVGAVQSYCNFGRCTTTVPMQIVLTS